MKQRGVSNQRDGRVSPAPKRRFRLVRLEERIAPKKGGKGTRNCGDSSGTFDCGGY